MSYNRYIARVPGEAFDADQIEGADPFYQTDAEWARTKAQADACSRSIVEFNARQRAKLGCNWTVRVVDHGNGRAEVQA